MKTALRSILLPAAVAAGVLTAPLFESRADACGSPVSITPAAEVQWAVQAALGDAATYEVESLRFVSADRALVDVRHTAGWRAGQRTRMIARLGEGGWAITARWAIRPSAPRSRTISAR